MPEQEPTLENYDHYINDLFAPEDEALRSTREAMARENIPRIHVSPSQGRLLQVLARGIGARRILEIGTLGGYSTLWLARAAHGRPSDLAGDRGGSRRRRPAQPGQCRYGREN
jgi:predicted O-methyltransferase YrrM